MSQQEVRRAARKAVIERQIQVRRERGAAERRYSELGVEVAVALGQRDDAIARFEGAAAEALHQLTRVEGLSQEAACTWAGDLTVSEARRILRTLPRDSSTAEGV
jgi:hypothetical protein